MFGSLALVALSFGLATASFQESNTTSTRIFTIVPAIPVIASSESHLETPHTPSTYLPTGTSSSLQDYGSTGPTHPMNPTPTITYVPSDSLTSGTPSAVAPIVHSEETQKSLETPTTYPSITKYPSPIALTKKTTVSPPTLPPSTPPTPPVSASPIALTSYPTVAPPTLPVSQQQGSITYVPAIVHTERPAESLELPPSQTYPTAPGYETTEPVAPVPEEGNGESPSPSAVPSEVTTVPTTLVTTVPAQVSTMSGGETMTIPAIVSTLPLLPVSTSSSPTTQTSSSNEPSETTQGGGAEESGSAGNEEGAASTFGVGKWSCSFLGVAVGAILLM